MTTDTFHWSCKHTWKRSAKNTAWCLLGCAIGDFGTILYFQITGIPWPFLAIMTLAIINGLITSIILETIILIRQNFKFNDALNQQPQFKSLFEYIDMLFTLIHTDGSTQLQFEGTLAYFKNGNETPEFTKLINSNIERINEEPVDYSEILNNDLFHSKFKRIIVKGCNNYFC